MNHVTKHELGAYLHAVADQLINGDPLQDPAQAFDPSVSDLTPRIMKEGVDANRAMMVADICSADFPDVTIDDPEPDDDTPDPNDHFILPDDEYDARVRQADQDAIDTDRILRDA